MGGGGSIYIYIYAASGFHDRKFRTQARVLQHRERMRRELTKDLLARMPNSRQSPQAQPSATEVPAHPADTAETARSPGPETGEDFSSVTGEDPMPAIDDEQIDMSECLLDRP